MRKQKSKIPPAQLTKPGTIRVQIKFDIRETEKGSGVWELYISDIQMPVIGDWYEVWEFVCQWRPDRWWVGEYIKIHPGGYIPEPVTDDGVDELLGVGDEQ